MASRNDITGDVLASKRNNSAYRDGWDRIFGKKMPEPQGEQLELWPEERIDIIGQNGNDGLHYQVKEEDDGEVE